MSLCWWLDWDWICLLYYVSNVIAWGVCNEGQYSCDVNILGRMSMYMCYAWDPWMFMIVYVDYDWCEGYPQWSVVDHLPICMNG